MAASSNAERRGRGRERERGWGGLQVGNARLGADAQCACVVCVCVQVGVAHSDFHIDTPSTISAPEDTRQLYHVRVRECIQPKKLITHHISPPPHSDCRIIPQHVGEDALCNLYDIPSKNSSTKSQWPTLIRCLPTPTTQDTWHIFYHISSKISAPRANHQLDRKTTTSCNTKHHHFVCRIFHQQTQAPRANDQS